MILPNPKRRGGWITTFTGVCYYALDPRPGDVVLEDIATGLSNECRYGGQIWPAYVVAQHSVLVALSLPHHLRKQGLLHDATEAYLKDIPRPIKVHLKEYQEIERLNAGCIGERFGVDLVNLPAEVHEADARCLSTEKRDLLRPVPGLWSETQSGNLPPWLAKITPWSHEEAKKNFLALAGALGIR